MIGAFYDYLHILAASDIVNCRCKANSADPFQTPRSALVPIAIFIIISLPRP